MTRNRKIGLALGGGAARGWAHIGVIKTLKKYNIEPDIVCGTSIGALVGAAFVTGKLSELESWVLTLRRRDVAGFLDFTFGGGMIEGDRLMRFFAGQLGEHTKIEDLPMPYGAVATDLDTGNEIWLQSGGLLDAVRASIALPGLFTPVCHDNRWLVDGGLVNPVPVSLCRAMGADIVIAVNLSRHLLGHSFDKKQQEMTPLREPGNTQSGMTSMKGWFKDILERFDSRVDETEVPGIFDVISNSITIMQDRLMRSRMAGDPPDLSLAPNLSDMNLLEFDRAEHAIQRGVQCVELYGPALESLVE